MPNVFIFVGHSGSGKTTLIEKLLHELKKQKVRTGTIKHAHHKVQLDTPGKDSWRYKQAGAEMSMLVTTNELQLIADSREQRDPEQIAKRFMGEVELVLAEGFSQAQGKKIEVLRRECSAVPRCKVEDGLIAMATDVEEIYPQLPHFELDDIRGIVRFMLGNK